MMCVDRDALICDLAQTYHIHDMMAYPLSHIAILACGLPENSRVMKKLAGVPVDINTSLLAGIFDRCSYLLWAKTKNAEKNRNRPPSIYDAIMSGGKQENSALFDSPEDFEAYRKTFFMGAPDPEQEGVEE